MVLKMRNIKFRVWDKHLNKFHFDINPCEGFWSCDGRPVFCHECESADYKDVNFEDNFIFQQFTGLLDSNGVEIYEGDLCETKKPNSYLDGIYEVTWHKTKGRWHYKDEDLYQVGCEGNTKCKVVGNIFENN
jgi:uncharacterized phage protein (TIGR01671 family)